MEDFIDRQRIFADHHGTLRSKVDQVSNLLLGFGIVHAHIIQHIPTLYFALFLHPTPFLVILQYRPNRKLNQHPSGTRAGFIKSHVRQLFRCGDIAIFTNILLTLPLLEVV